MGLLDKAKAKGLQQMLDSLKSEDDLKKWEAQGYDMSIYREQYWDVLSAKFAATAQKEAFTLAARYGIGEFDPSAAENPISLNKLDSYKSTPRDTGSNFVKDCAGKLPTFGKDKVLNKVAEAPLIFASVVQAHALLWKPDNAKGAKGMVIVFARNDARRYDLAWVKGLSKKISDLKTGAEVPGDCKKFIQTLRNDQSYFCFPVGASISGGADAWCATYTINDQSIFPKSHIPTEGIVPILLLEQPKENKFVELSIVASKYYAG
jgi:hypothetical protein